MAVETTVCLCGQLSRESFLWSAFEAYHAAAHSYTTLSDRLPYLHTVTDSVDVEALSFSLIFGHVTNTTTIMTVTEEAMSSLPNDYV